MYWNHLLISLHLGHIPLLSIIKLNDIVQFKVLSPDTRYTFLLFYPNISSVKSVVFIISADNHLCVARGF